MLNGERVVLRPVRPDDVEPLWAAKLDPVTWAQTTEDPLVPETLAATRTRWEAPTTPAAVRFAVDVDGALAGSAALFGVDDLARQAEVGLSLLPERRGQGLGKDVVRVLCGYGFRSRNLRRLHLQALSSNAAALAVYRGCGFVEEGRRREAAWVEGGYEDVVLLSLLRREWAGSR